MDEAAVLEQLRTFFAAHPRQALPPVYLPQEMLQLGRREVRSTFATELSRLVISWHVPGITHPDIPALDVLATLLGEGRSSRLYRTVREEQELAHSISAFSYVPVEPGLFGIEATTDPDKRSATEAAARAIVADVQEHGVTEAELAKAKRMILNNQINALVTMRGQASDLGSNWLLTGNLDFSRLYLESIQNVSGDDIIRVARRYLRIDNSTVAALDPLDYPQAGSGETQVLKAAEIQKFELSNGLRVLVREDGRLPLVYLDAVFRGGLLAETGETNGLGKLFSRVWLKGTASRSAEELAEQIEAVGGSIGSESGNNSFSLSLEVMEPDLDLGLDIFADLLLNATLPEDAIEREKLVQIASVKTEDEHVTSVARNLLRSSMFGEHPYGLRGSGSERSILALTRQQLVEFQESHVTARNGVVAIFGNVNAGDVRARLELLLSQLPSGEKTAPEKQLPSPLRLTAPKLVEKHEDKEQAVLMIGYHGTTVGSADRFALELIDEASSDLGSRFFIRIREELGLAYFVGSSQMLGLSPGLFSFYLGTDPLKMDEVRAAFTDEIAKLGADGLTAEELARAKKKVIGKQAIASQSNASLAYTAALDELYDLGYLYHLKLAEQIDAVTLEQVREVAQRYFLEPGAVTAIVRPPTSQRS